VILVGASVVAAGSYYFLLYNNELPTRAECLQRIDIVDIDPSRQHDYDDVVFFFVSDSRRSAPQTSGSGFGRDRTQYFIQFHDDCDRKAEILRPILERFNRLHGDVARLELYPGRVEPGPDTLMIGGPYWRD
jgi:hypothetical protein